jgi:hypothetical protein
MTDFTASPDPADLPGALLVAVPAAIRSVNS